MRGNRRCLPHPGSQLRSIPACAGEPSAPGCRLRGSRVYPRVCGGTRHRGRMVGRVAGLSPRVRGNLRERERRMLMHRSIPACAGEPYRRRRSGGHTAVYPRVCGGTGAIYTRSMCRYGLSPRVRGNRCRMPSIVTSPGSIPACAGEPAPVSMPADRAAGLSPRVRGNLPPRPTILHPRRSIPACAGEPPRSAHTCRLAQVYPRVCGGTPLTPRRRCTA